MDFRCSFPLTLAALATAAVVCGCSRPPPPTAQPAPVNAASAAAPAPPPPAKKTVMICRNSVDGRKVACGTPNAVMVGIKTE